MTAKEHLERILSDATELVYAKEEKEGDFWHIATRSRNRTAPKLELFTSEAECKAVWEKFVETMTKRCLPPCIEIGNALFQPRYLLELGCYSDERAHFVILNFGENQTLWLGYAERSTQIKLYLALLEALGEEVTEKDKGPSAH